MDRRSFLKNTALGGSAAAATAAATPLEAGLRTPRPEGRSSCMQLCVVKVCFVWPLAGGVCTHVVP